MGALKADDCLEYLSELASTKLIKFIVSLDHIKSGVLWKDQLLDRFNFYSFQINTFADIDIEQ